MKLINIFIVFFIILFFVIFLLSFQFTNNQLIKYRVSKEILPQKELNYAAIKNKYVIKKCGQMCKQEVCNDYHNQLIRFDLCKDCAKQYKCYDPNLGICTKCSDNLSCEQKFGCNNTKPQNPKDMYCRKCWN